MDSSAELNRRLESLLRWGKVMAVDHGGPGSPPRCRVKSGKLETEWLPWFNLRAGTTRTWSPPTVGEQVMLLCPSGDPATGAVLGGLYSEANPAPSDKEELHVLLFPDGATITYDHLLGALVATGVKSATVEASETITAKAGAQLTLEAPLVRIKGQVVQDGGTMSSNGVVVHTHVHGGVTPGGASTAGPQ